MPGVTESAKQAAQAEARLARIVRGRLNPAYKAALDARMETAMALLPVLKPIAEKHGVPVEQLLAIHVVETRGRGDPMSRTNKVGASGPFQLTPDARKDFPPSMQYATTVESDADSAAQYLKASRAAGFTMPEAIGMTYIAGITGVKNWGGGNEGNVGEHSKDYGPMFKYALDKLAVQIPEYTKQQSERERAARSAGAAARRQAFDQFPVPKMKEGIAAFFGPSEEEVTKAREARMSAAEQAEKQAFESMRPEAPLQTMKKAGYK